MTRQNISTGTSANDGTGDTLRSAGTKINANFTELYTFLGGNADTLSSQISLGSDGIIFEGSSADDFETTLKVTNPTSSDKTITFPDATGNVILDTATQTITNKTLGEVFFQSSEITANGTASADATHIICNKGTALAVILGTGTTSGEFKIFTNKGAGTATITPTDGVSSIFAGGNSFELEQNEGATCIWDGSNWFLIGNQSIANVT
jgi:hypothetical protein